MTKLECTSCGAPLDKFTQKCPYCKTSYAPSHSPFRQDNQKVYGAQVNIGGSIRGSVINVGNVSGNGIVIGNNLIVKQDFVGRDKIVIIKEK